MHAFAKPSDEVCGLSCRISDCRGHSARAMWPVTITTRQGPVVNDTCKVEELISDILNELPCSGDLENPGQLQQRFSEVLMIFIIVLFVYSTSDKTLMPYNIGYATIQECK